jgi:hypothetical protein
MPSKDPYANTSRGRNRGRGERPSDEKQTANMKSFLTGRNKTKTKKPTSTKTITTGTKTITTGSGVAAVQPKKEATPKTFSQGNIGRTTTKYDTPKGKARVEKLPTDAEEKKVSGPGTYQGGKSYMNSNYSNYMNNSFNRRK